MTWFGTTAEHLCEAFGRPSIDSSQLLQTLRELGNERDIKGTRGDVGWINPNKMKNREQAVLAYKHLDASLARTTREIHFLSDYTRKALEQVRRDLAECIGKETTLMAVSKNKRLLLPEVKMRN